MSGQYTGVAVIYFYLDLDQENNTHSCNEERILNVE